MSEFITEESRSIAVMKAALLAFGSVMVTWPLVDFSALVTVGVMSVLGSVTGRKLSRTLLKWWSVVSLGIGICVLGVLLGIWIRSSTLLLGWINATHTLTVGDAVCFGLISGGVALLLRFASSKRQALSILEAFFVVGAVAHVFARHRNLAVDRPRFLTDWALVNGLDPQAVLLGLGIGVSIFAILLALRSQRWSKLALTLLALLGIGLAVNWFLVDQRVEIEIEDMLGNADDQKDSKGNGGDCPEGTDPSDGTCQSNPDGSGGGRGGGGGGGTPPLPVAVALIHADYEPAHGLLYFRQQVLSRFNGKRLVVDRSDRFDQDVITELPLNRSMHAGDKVPNIVSQRIRLIDKLLGVNFSKHVHVQDAGLHLRVPTSMFLLADHPQPFSLGASVEVRPRENPNPRRFVMAYDAISMLLSVPVNRLLGRQSVPDYWSDEERDHYLSFPDDPRYQSLAVEIEREMDPRYLGDPIMTALQIKGFLEREGFYTRKERHAGVDDPTASFLFGSRRGYCVHFAHSAVHLFRSQGIASRVALGYMVDNRMRAGGSSVLIMGDRAHAWPEIHLAGVGWIPFDIYPEASDEAPPRIVSQSLESLLGEIARGDPSGGRKADPNALSFSIPWALIFSWLLIIVASIILFGYVVKFWRALRPVFGEASHVDAFVSVLDRFSELGHARNFGESREGHARRLGVFAPTMFSRTQLHLRLHLGRSNDDDKEKILDLCARVKAELSAALPAWKITLGWINPWGWWFTR